MARTSVSQVENGGSSPPRGTIQLAADFGSSGVTIECWYLEFLSESRSRIPERKSVP